MKNVVIFGAGITGLAAADRLAELGGCRVTVIEAEPHVGGLASTVHRNGIATDFGPHRLYSEIREVRSFWKTLMGDRLQSVRRSSRMYLCGRWIPYPLRTREVFRALGPGRVAQIGAGLIGARLRSLLPVRRADTFEQEMRRAFGAGAYRLVFEPYARKVWRIDPDELSAAIARVRLPERGVVAAFGSLFRPARSAVRIFQYPRGGIGQLAETLEERVRQAGGDIRLGHRVARLQFGMSGLCGIDLKSDIGTTSLDCDAAISTIPVPELGVMLPGCEIEQRTALGRLEYLSIILVVLIVSRDRIGPDHWLYFPHDPPIVTRASEPKNFDESMMPSDRTCLCCEITARPSEALWETDDETIADRVRREIVATGIVSDEAIVDQFVMRKSHAYPLYVRGFEKDLDVVTSLLARFRNLVSTGRQGLFNHNNIDHCIVMGRRAAEVVANESSPAQRWYRDIVRFNRFRIID